LHDPLQPNAVSTDTSNAFPTQFAFTLTPVPFDYEIDSSCRVATPPPGGCLCDSLAKDVADGFTYTTSALQLNVKPVSLDTDCDSVSWDFGDGFTATSQGNNPVVHNYIYGGTYLVCMYVMRYANDGTVCEDSICYNVDVPGGVGLAEDERFGLKIYPNPANEKLYISLERPDADILYEIYSAVGIRVAEGRLDDAVNTIDVGTYPSGIYIIRINIGGEFITKKVFVE
jgi:hypothetical protein